MDLPKHWIIEAEWVVESEGTPMAQKAVACFEKLTDPERASLLKISRCTNDKNIPDEHAEKLLSLGLAELNCGDLGPTSSGRIMLSKCNNTN